MKRLITFLLALLLTWIGANAQSYYVDYSSKMSTATTDWSVASGTFRTGVEYFNDTATSFSGLDMSQTITGLPAGTYTVSFYATVNEANGSTNNQSGTAYLVYVQDTSTEENYKSATVGTLSAAGIAWGAGDFATPYTFTVTLTEGQSLKYGISNTGGGGNWAVIQPVSLLLNVTTQTERDLVHDCLPIAGPVLNDDASRWWPLNWSSNTSTAVGNFHVNTWSTEGASDGTGMTTPFVEYWFDSGTNVADAVLSHETLTGLTPGLYEVSVLARAYNEGSSTAVGAGITFNANSASVDLTTGTVTSGTTPAMAYGTYTVIAEVGDAGTLDINFTIQSETSCDWLAWKDLKVVYDGESLPDLEYVTGDMNADVETAMKAAVDAYNTSKSTDDYTTALAAIEAAEESVAQYAEVAALVANLDDAGKAVWETTTSGSAYSNKTLTTSDDITDDMVAAQRAQTSANTDWSYVLKNTGTWVNAISATNFQNCPSLPTAHEIWSSSAWSVPSGATSAEAIYKRIENLPAGEYSISFYAYGNAEANASRPLAFANDKETEVAYASALVWDESSLYTLSCTVNVSGELDFGMKTQGAGNWYVMEEGSLTLVKLAEGIEAGEKVHSCTAEFSHWTQTYTGEGTNGTYAYNDWSTEADASGMVTPFLQTWVYQALLSDQTIDHNQLTGMPQGWYSVTVDARIMSETGAAITGTATLTANKDFIYLISDGSDGTYGTESEEYGTYTVQCYVDEDGTLDIGFTIKDANFNWLAWKNLSVVYLGETVEYNVGEATASETTVTPGQTVTLTFADCTKGDEDATLGVSSSANVTFGETSVTLTTKGTITFTFDVPNVTESGEYTLTLPASTIVWTYNGETKAGNAAQTITFSVLVPATIDDGEYLIVDAEGNYLGGGLAYGTEAAIIGKPQFIGFEAQENGTYHLDSHQYNSETAHYLGSNLYFDSSAIDWTLVEVEDGYAIYGTADTGTGYLTSNGFQTVATIGETPYAWTLVTMDDIVASMADATEDAPVDVTALIASPEMKRNSNTTYYPTWTVSTGSVTFGQNSTIGGTATANCAESWHSDGGFDVNQTITLPLAGTYKLSAQGFHTGEETIVLYAGEDTADLPIPTTDPADQAAAYQAFLEGTYPVDAITITTYSSDETVTIGFKGDNSSEWVVMGELDLQYLGVVEETVTWTMTDANWGTLILPFAVAADDVPADLTIYTCDGTSTSTDSDGNETTTVTVNAVEGGIAANTPYLVKGNVEVDTEYTFSGTPVEATGALTNGLLTGTYKTLTYTELSALTGTVYLLQNHTGEGEEGVAFYPVTEGSTDATLTANHCYLTLSSSSGVRAYIGFPNSGEETGIVAVESETLANDAIYDLSGRRVSKAVKGVYIQNGKKVLVK